MRHSRSLDLVEQGVRIEIVLEKVSNLLEISLEVKDKLFHLSVDNKYELRLDLPADVDESKTAAKFNTETKTLTAILTFKQESIATKLPASNRDHKVSNSYSYQVHEDSLSFLPVSEDTPGMDLNNNFNTSKQSTEESDSKSVKVVDYLTLNEKKWKEIHEAKDSVSSSADTLTFQRKQEKAGDSNSLLRPTLDLDSILSID